MCYICDDFGIGNILYHSLLDVRVWHTVYNANVPLLFPLFLCFPWHRHPQDGMVNPTVRKDMKGSQKLYCCPIEGCPRGPNRPFSQFSLVKQVSLFFPQYPVTFLWHQQNKWMWCQCCGIAGNVLFSTNYLIKIYLTGAKFHWIYLPVLHLPIQNMFTGFIKLLLTEILSHC